MLTAGRMTMVFWFCHQWLTATVRPRRRGFHHGGGLKDQQTVPANRGARGTRSICPINAISRTRKT